MVTKGQNKTEEQIKPKTKQIANDTIKVVAKSQPNFGLPAPFCFRVRGPRVTDRRTDRRTGKTRSAAYKDGRTTYGVTH